MKRQGIVTNFALAALMIVAGWSVAAQPPKEMTVKVKDKEGKEYEFKMVLIPGGKFKMGSPEGEEGRKKHEGPQHEVEINPFYLATTEVTFDIFLAYYHETVTEKKGTDAAEQIQAGRLVKQAGIELSEYVILGLGGVDRSRAHALQTAAALNAIAPDFVRLRTLVPKINTLLLHQIQKGRFELLTAHQVLQETRLLLENLDCRTTLTSDHYTNYLDLSGKLPRDKKRLLAEIDRSLQRDPESFRPIFIGNQ